MFILPLLLACSDTETKTETPAETKPKIEQKAEEAKPATKEEATPKAAKVESTGSCDDQLKEYSAFVDEYIALMKKANAGDLSAVQKYPALLEKAEKSGKDLEVLHKDGKIDADCWKKYNAINNRMTQAAMEMSGASQKDKEEMKKLQKMNDKAIDQTACIQKCQSKTDPMAQATCMQSCM